jgi:hypothetical protein
MARFKASLLVGSVLAVSLGACSADLSLNNVTFKPETALNQPGWNVFSGKKNAAADLLNADGQCGAAASEQAGAGTGGISLHMTECEVVRRAGPVEKFEFGQDNRAERSLVLTYLHGPAPGIYRFSGGRLVAIERAPTPAPEVPQKRGATKKPAGS